MLHLDACPLCQGTDLQPFITTSSQMHDGSGHFTFERCSGCGLVMLNPRVAQEKLKDYYQSFYLPYRGSKAWGKHAKRVAQSQQQLDKRRAALLGKYRNLDAQSHILDVGCGRPTFLEACQKRYGALCQGIDFSDAGWAEESQRFEPLQLSVQTLEELEVEQAPDVISMWHYLEHDYAPMQTLERLRDIAHEQTLLVIEVPNFDSAGRRKFGADWAGYHTPRHTFLFSPDNLRMALEKTGWTWLDGQRNGTLDAYNLYWMSKMEQKGIDWTKNMATEFWGYVQGMLWFRFKRLFAPPQSYGVMTVLAQKA